MVVPAILLFLASSPAFDASLRAGLLALEKNDLAQARANLENAAQIEPSDAKVWVALAQTFWKLHDVNEAKEAASKAERLGPQDVAVQHALPMTYTRQELDGSLRYDIRLQPPESGSIAYGVRVLPSHPALANKHEMGLIRWG